MSTSNRNLISNLLFVLFGLFVELVTGLGLFWLSLLLWPNSNTRLWLSLVIGVVLASAYGVSIGTVALYFVVSIFVMRLVLEKVSGDAWVVIALVILADMLWRYIFGLGLYWWSSLGLLVFGVIFNRRWSWSSDSLLKLRV
jgi:hypothetical protein